MLTYFLQRPTLLLFILLSFTLASCSTDNPNEEQPDLPLADPELLAQMAYGQELMEGACYSCHNPDESSTGRLAPPMVAVKEHYINEGTSFDTFADELVRFVQRPSKGYAKMHGAINVFGLMPAQPHNEADLRAIAAYLYHGDLTKPDWLTGPQRQEIARQHQRAKGRADFADRGRKYALQTKSVLGANLMQAIKAGGPENAISFCTTRALPLTDSMALAQGVSMQRVSDRARNPENMADSLEMLQIAALKEDLQRGVKMPHRLVESATVITGYYPIITNGMCLQCHGEPGSDVSPATLSALEALYPEDRATGYAANELRGVWVVEMEKE